MPAAWLTVCLPQAKQLDTGAELSDHHPFEHVTLVMDAVQAAKLHYALSEEKTKAERLWLELQGAANSQKSDQHDSKLVGQSPERGWFRLVLNCKPALPASSLTCSIP